MEVTGQGVCDVVHQPWEVWGVIAYVVFHEGFGVLAGDFIVDGG